MNAHGHQFTLPHVPHPILRHQPDWYRKSGITECATCDGEGRYPNGRGLGCNDPDSWDIE